MKKLLVIALTMIMILSSYAPAFAVDSYSEYFSEEREFVVGPDSYDPSVYFYLNQDDNGHIYSHNIETGEKTLLLSENVSKYYFNASSLYCVINESQIVELDIFRGTIVHVLTVEGPINQLYVTKDLIYYLSGNTIYRYHRDSKRTDTIVSDENIYFFYPYSNYIIEYGSEANESSQTVVKRYNSNTKETMHINQYTYILDIYNSSTISSRSSASVNMHGSTLPYSPYTNGKYYNNSGTSPCQCHSSTNCPESCGSCKSYDGPKGIAYQCHAFGSEIFKHVWGKYTSQKIVGYDISQTALAKSVFGSLQTGTMVRAYLKKDNGKHTFIIADVSTSGITIYDANSDNKCGIRYGTITFEQIANAYSEIYFIYEGLHNFSSSYNYNIAKHWKYCSQSGCDGKIMGAHTFLTSGNVKTCSVCGYSVSLSRTQ